MHHFIAIIVLSFFSVQVFTLDVVQITVMAQDKTSKSKTRLDKLVGFEEDTPPASSLQLPKIDLDSYRFDVSPTVLDGDTDSEVVHRTTRRPMGMDRLVNVDDMMNMVDRMMVQQWTTQHELHELQIRENSRLALMTRLPKFNG